MTGLCACGCGAQTTIATRNRYARGLVKGQPARFLPGHNTRGENHHLWKGGIRFGSGYRHIYRPDHDRADWCGYVREHILIAEHVLGRPLPNGAVVHHANGIKDDNRNNNLCICQDEAYHQELHRRKRAVAACGNPDWIRCKYCKNYDDPTQMQVLISAGGRHRLARHPGCKRLRRTSV